MAIFSDNEELQGFRLSFVRSSKEKTDNLEQWLLSLEQRHSSKDFKEILRKIFSETHSIKGAARAYGMVEVSIICHKFEDLLLEVLNQAKEDEVGEQTEVMLYHVDALGNYFNEFLANKKVNVDAFREHYPKIFNDAGTKVEDKKIAPGLNATTEGKKINVLLVGLTKPIIKQVHQALHGIQHKIGFAGDAMDGLYRIAHEHFDLVLSSYMMAPINGISFASAIKTQWREESPKIVVFSSEHIKDLNQVATPPDRVMLKSQGLPQELRNYFFKEFIDSSAPEAKPSAVERKGPVKMIKNVYFIDDDENILNLLSMLFEDKGHVLAYTGTTTSDPLADLARRLPDLIVSDINIPNVDILKLLKNIKSHPVLKNVPVIFLTGDVDQPQCRELLKAGAHTILDKSLILSGFFEELKNSGFDF